MGEVYPYPVRGELLIRGSIPGDSGFCYDQKMRDLLILFVHAIATLVRLIGPGGVRSVVAESVLVKQQLLILNRSRPQAPKLRAIVSSQDCAFFSCVLLA